MTQSLREENEDLRKTIADLQILLKKERSRHRIELAQALSAVRSLREELANHDRKVREESRWNKHADAVLRNYDRLRAVLRAVMDGDEPVIRAVRERFQLHKVRGIAFVGPDGNVEIRDEA